MHRWRIACAVMGLLVWICAAHAAEPAPTATLTLSGEAVQPAGAPVVLQLLIHNTGTSRISYWCSGPGEYPDAADYTATVTRADVKGEKIPLTNGQNPAADGQLRDVASGRSVRFPATLGILAPGAYQIVIESAAQVSGPRSIITWPATRSTNIFRLEVRHDNDLAAARDAQIIARVRANDPFARFVAARWRSRVVREALVADLKGDDIVAADRAADGLWGDADPAKVDGPLVASVILKHLKPPPGECDVGLMTRLTRGSAPLDSDAVKAAMSKLLVARPEGIVRQATAAALDRSAETPASTKLFQLPHADSDFDTSDEAQRRRHDAALLGAMLELARSEDVHERKLAYAALADFPSSQAAIEALHVGQQDPDGLCQSIAGHSLNLILQKLATTRP